MADQLSIYGDYGYRVADDGSKQKVRPNTPPAYVVLPLWSGTENFRDFGPLSDGVTSVPLSLWINHAPGTYDYGSDNAFPVIPSTFWASVLADEKHGDFHVPNPLTTGWLGGTLYMEPYTYYTPGLNRFRGTSSHAFDPYSGESISSGNPVSRRYLSSTSSTPTITGDYTSKARPAGVVPTMCPLFLRDVGPDGDFNNCVLVWNTDGRLPVDMNSRTLYGPNLVNVTVSGLTVTARFTYWRSWGWKPFNRMSGELTCTTTLSPKSLTVGRNGHVVVNGTLYQSYSGWWVDSAIINNPGPRPVSGSRTVKYADNNGASYLMAFGAGAGGFGTSEEKAKACELTKAFARSHATILTYRAELQRLEDSTMIEESQVEALKNEESLASNWIENLTGLPSAGDLVGPIAQLQKAFKKKDPLAIVKGISSAFLVWKYVVAPSVSDYQDVKDNAASLWDTYVSSAKPAPERRVGSAKEDRVPGHSGPGSRVAKTTYNMSVRRDPFSRLWRALCAFGVEPTAANLWDLIPYSFVIDWFIPIGDALDTVSKLGTGIICYDDVTWCTSYTLDRQEKYTALFSAIPSSLHFHYCKRVGGRGFPGINAWEAATACDSRLTASQLLQGSALTVQKIIK